VHKKSGPAAQFSFAAAIAGAVRHCRQKPALRWQREVAASSTALPSSIFYLLPHLQEWEVHLQSRAELHRMPFGGKGEARDARATRIMREGHPSGARGSIKNLGKPLGMVHVKK
jgi:hypothetical protein